MDARLAFYLKEDPTKWDDETWALKWAQLQYVLKNDYKEIKALQGIQGL